MEITDSFVFWVNVPISSSLCLEPLSKTDFEYWAGRKRWPLLSAIYLSLGYNPHARHKNSGKLLKIKFPSKEQVSDFRDRLIKVDEACKNGSLVYENVLEYNAEQGQIIKREVDSKTFIAWAMNNFSENCESLFEMTLKTYKSDHSISGSQKGKKADEVKKLITEAAIIELDAGCKCHNSELARYLMKLKDKNGKPKYILPGIMEDRYEAHFLKAVNIAFKEKDIPLRNKSKSAETIRGKDLCKRPGHAPSK